jgi:NAD(P)-dependent dehydrogenase (short-subunit alcohol dehydrogenase family)
VTRDNLLMRMKDDEFADVIRINLEAAFRLMRAAAKPMMKARFGRIISVASVVGVTGNPGQANYVASKAGLIGMTKSVAQELASLDDTDRRVLENDLREGDIGKFAQDEGIERGSVRTRRRRARKELRDRVLKRTEATHR